MTVTAGETAPLRRSRWRLSPAEWRSVVGMTAMICGLHLFGWIVLVTVVAPAHYSVGGKAFVPTYSSGLTAASASGELG